MCERETTGIASGFTPVFDEIARDPKLGPIAALVFGKVWRYCNAYGKCTASRDSMAQQVGLSYKTFERWLAVLCEKGYLEDLTPNRRHRPHHYRDTGKVKMRVRVKAEGGTESQPGKEVGQRVQPGRTESPTRTDLESVKEREKRETEKDNRERGPDGPQWTLSLHYAKWSIQRKDTATDPRFGRHRLYPLGVKALEV